MLLNHLDKGNGQEHRHRIIATGFNLQGGAHAFVQSFAAEQREDRRGVGGADNRADQHPLDKIEMEQPRGHHPGQTGGDQHANGRQ